MADTGKTIGLIKALASVDPSVIQSSVEGWLDDHPEATTTVEDGAITKAKLDSSLQQTVDDVGDLKSAITSIENLEGIVAMSGTYSGTRNKIEEISPLPAGNYHLTIDSITSTDTDKTTSRLLFQYGSTELIDFQLDRNIPIDIYFTLESPANKVYFYASSSYAYSANDTFSFNNFALAKTYGLIDEINDIKRDINDNENRLNSFSNETYNIINVPIGHYSCNENTGEISSANSNYVGLSDKISCNANTKYVARVITSNNINAEIKACFYDDEGEFLSSQAISWSNSYILTSPANANYLYVHFYNSGTFGDGYNIIISEGEKVLPYVPDESVIDYIARNGDAGLIEFTETAGYFNANGTIANQSANKEVYTQRIDLSQIKYLAVSVKYNESRAMWLCYASYNSNGEFISRNVVLNATTSVFTKFLTFDSNAKYVAFAYRKYTDGVLTIMANANTLETLNVANRANNRSSQAIETAEQSKALSLIGSSPFRLKSCYDHLFVNSTNYIPHESTYHVRLSKQLGFNCIEANIQKTNDDVYIVNHGSSNAIGNYLMHIDGTTDISSILYSDKSWSWFVNNTVYRTPIKKYQTRPTRLEEFLSECRQQNIIPFIAIKDNGVRDMANAYMGENNYIAYGASRETCPNAIIYSWQSEGTKEAILARCEKYGKPFIYGMANPTAFSDADLKDIVNTLHDNGYWIGVSYNDDEWYKYSYLGFDINGTQTLVNRVDSGNICNIDSVYGFSGFAYTNATETDGILTYSANGTLVPTFASEVVSVGTIDIQLEFIGTITIPSIGIRSSKTITSDGSIPVFYSIPIFNGSNAVSISVTSGTVIKDCMFKASKY